MDSQECECGQAKRPKAVACERCMFLDGYRSAASPGPAIAEVIHVLRGREMRAQELLAYTGLDPGAFGRVIRNLLKQGRVSRRYSSECGFTDQVEALYRLQDKHG